MPGLGKLRNLPKILRNAIPRSIRNCIIFLWNTFWESCPGTIIKWILNRLWEAQAYLILIRPYEAKHRNSLDWWYAGTWWLNHWVYYVFIASTVLEIWPETASSWIFQHTMWLVSHPHRIEEHIPIFVSAATGIYVWLNHRDKRIQRARNAKAEFVERWRGGQYFPVIWLAFAVAFRLVLEPLGYMPAGHVVTDATISIFAINGGIRAITWKLKKDAQEELEKAQQEFESRA